MNTDFLQKEALSGAEAIEMTGHRPLCKRELCKRLSIPKQTMPRTHLYNATKPMSLASCTAGIGSGSKARCAVFTTPA